MKLVFTFVAALVIAGCGAGRHSSTADLDELDVKLDGTWVLQLHVPGAYESMTLSQSGSVLTGTGEYRIEAGRCGTSQVSGTFSDGVISIASVRDYGQGENFRGRLAKDNTMAGTLTYDNFNQQFDSVFVRQ